MITVFITAQAVFWYGIKIPGDGEEEAIIWRGTRSIKPDLGIVPDVPTPAAVQAMSFGDNQFYFRLRAYDIQNAGDTFGRVTSLKDYNYEKLYKWWKILDGLDPVSDFIPSLVSYYFGATQKQKEHIPFVVKYLEEHADTDPKAKWWWYSQAVYHANHKLKDSELALKIAKKLASLPEDVQTPIWTRQMHAFIHEDRGEYKEACEIILHIVDNWQGLEEGELNFMHHFIEERVAAMIKDKENLSADLDPRCLAIVELKSKEQSEARE